MFNLIGFDLETFPHLTIEAITQYQEKEIAKIQAHGTWKDATKQTKIDEIIQGIMDLKAGKDSEIGREIIKDFSINPLLNRICAIGLSFKTYKGEFVEISKAGDDELSLLNWFFDNLGQFVFQTTEDPVFCGHNVVGFDVPTMRMAIIRHQLFERVANLKLKRDQLFPLSKYNSAYIDTMNFMNGTLDDIATAVLGECKVSHGSKVYGMFKNKEWEKMEEYVSDDASKSFKIVSLMNRI